MSQQHTVKSAIIQASLTCQILSMVCVHAYICACMRTYVRACVSSSPFSATAIMSKQTVSQIVSTQICTTEKLTGLRADLQVHAHMWSNITLQQHFDDIPLTIQSPCRNTGLQLHGIVLLNICDSCLLVLTSRQFAWQTRCWQT